MTLTGRNLSLRVAFTGLVLISVAVVVAFVGAANGKYVPTPVRLSIDELLAVSGALLAAALGVSMAAVYLRLFRRTPSLAVFFVIWFYLAMVVDVLKLVQVVLPSTPWPQFGPAISRIGVFGHVTGVMALFAAGLYAGGVRMQRHGTAIFVACVIAFGLSWSIPIDTSFLPSHLVYRAGVRASLQATLILLLVVSVVNFVQASINNGNPRQLLSALAIALLATGRELLFYRIEPVWLATGAVSILVGGILFAGQNYRDFLLS
tara:strand:- start:147 stop:932 length:786 start_codon:yes stop_codon:yes gene_type:complete